MNSFDHPALTASEQIFLQGEKFAEKANLLNKYKVMSSGQDVSLKDLAMKAVAAAFLASERAGAIRLEVRQVKGFLGLGKVSVIFAEPLKPVDFPAGSLESKIFDLATEFKDKKEKNEVWLLVYTWLRLDASSPWQVATRFIQAGLGERQLLDVIQEKKLKIFTTTHYELPEATRALAAELPTEPVQQLLGNCRDYRPELWELLMKHIKKGFESRVERDTSD